MFRWARSRPYGHAAAQRRLTGERGTPVAVAEQVLPRSDHAAGFTRLEQQSVGRLADGCFGGRAGARSPPVSTAPIRPEHNRSSSAPRLMSREGHDVNWAKVLQVASSDTSLGSMLLQVLGAQRSIITSSDARCGASAHVGAAAGGPAVEFPGKSRFTALCASARTTAVAKRVLCGQ